MRALALAVLAACGGGGGGAGSRHPHPTRGASGQSTERRQPADEHVTPVEPMPVGTALVRRHRCACVVAEADAETDAGAVGVALGVIDMPP